MKTSSSWRTGSLVIALCGVLGCATQPAPTSPATAPTTPPAPTAAPTVAAAPKPTAAPAPTIATAAPAPTAAPASGTGGKTVAYLAAVADNPYFDYMVCGAKHAARDNGGSLIAQAPSKFDPVEQTQILNAIVARKPDAIVIDAIDVNAMTPPIKSVINQGIPVVTSEEEIQVPGQVTNLVSDQVMAGQLGAQTLLKLMGTETGKVFVMDFQTGVASTDERRQGFEAELKNHSGITYLGQQYAGADSTKAAQLTLGVLQANPDVVGVFSTNLYGAQGVINALKQTGKSNDVKLVTMDLLPNEADWIKAGDLNATIAQKPYEVGRQSTEVAFQYLGGKRDFPQTMHVTDPFTVVTQENLNTPDVQKLIPTSQCDI